MPLIPKIKRSGILFSLLAFSYLHQTVALCDDGDFTTIFQWDHTDLPSVQGLEFVSKNSGVPFDPNAPTAEKFFWIRNGSVTHHTVTQMVDHNGYRALVYDTSLFSHYSIETVQDLSQTITVVEWLLGRLSNGTIPIIFGFTSPDNFYEFDHIWVGDGDGGTRRYACTIRHFENGQFSTVHRNNTCFSLARSYFDHRFRVNVAGTNVTVSIQPRNGDAPFTNIMNISLEGIAGLAGVTDGYISSPSYPRALAGPLWSLKIQVPTANTTTGIQFNPGSDQRSRLLSIDIDLTRPSSSMQADDGAVSLLSAAGTTNIAADRLSLQGNKIHVDTSNLSLPDGQYTVIVDGDKLRLEGIPLDADSDGLPGGRQNFSDDTLFIKFGDVNGDGSVGHRDFIQFRAAFGSTAEDANFRAYFDWNQDGSIGVADFMQFRPRFGS